jgi:hypothetical protein
MKTLAVLVFALLMFAGNPLDTAQAAPSVTPSPPADITFHSSSDLV